MRHRCTEYPIGYARGSGSASARTRTPRGRAESRRSRGAGGNVAADPLRVRARTEIAHADDGGAPARQRWVRAGGGAEGVLHRAANATVPPGGRPGPALAAAGAAGIGD